jgi:hypothetical protein
MLRFGMALVSPVCLRLQRAVLAAALLAIAVASLGLAAPNLDLVQSLAQERYGQRAASTVADWRKMLEEARGLDEAGRLEAVNGFFNRRVLFEDDIVVWKEKDYWASPLEFMGRGAGDCEDFSIAKYAAAGRAERETAHDLCARPTRWQPDRAHGAWLLRRAHRRTDDPGQPDRQHPAGVSPPGSGAGIQLQQCRAVGAWCVGIGCGSDGAPVALARCAREDPGRGVVVSRTGTMRCVQARRGLAHSMLRPMQLIGIIIVEALPGVEAVMRDWRIAPGFFFERLLCR